MRRSRSLSRLLPPWSPRPQPPKPTATPLRIAAQVVGFDSTLFGKNGEKMAALKGESAAFDPKNLSSALIVNKAQATLYDREKRDIPVSELTAETVTADRARRTLTATGNVTIRSLTEKGTPTIRADRMVWSFDNRTVKGDGNVLLTAEPNLKMPGKVLLRRYPSADVPPQKRRSPRHRRNPMSKGIPRESFPKENKRSVKKQYIGIVLLLGIALVGLLRLTPAAAQEAKQQEAKQKAGKFSIENIGPFEVTWDEAFGVIKNGNTVTNFSGGPGGKVHAKTARYDIIAPRISMTFTRTSAPETAEATGGVTGEARSPEKQEAISFRGDKATYRAATGGNDARIDFSGNVRFVIRNPQFADTAPLTLSADSGSLTFAADGAITYKLNKGSAGGTPLEPEKKKKP